MSILFAGQPLLLGDPARELVAWVDRALSLGDLRLFGRQPVAIEEGRQRPRLPARYKVGLPTVNWPTPPSTRINSLYWPTGATRWAQGLFLVDGLTAGKITDFIGTGGHGTLEISDGTHTLDAEMYALTPRPLNNPPSEGDTLFLLPLVDKRYFWQLRDVNLSVAACGSWDAVLASIATALGVTLHYTPITSYYYPDDVELTRHWENAAVLLDAVAWTLGRRVVVQPDGKVHLMTATDSLNVLEANQTGWSSEFATDIGITKPTDTDWAVWAGGVRRTQLESKVPAQLRVVYPKWFGTTADNAGDVLDVEVSGTDYLPLVQAGTTKTFYETARADYRYSPAYNYAECVNLARHIACDYYTWAQAPQLDISFAGVRQWVLGGCDDFAHWHAAVQHSPASDGPGSETDGMDYGDYRCYTRTATLPADVGVAELLHQFCPHAPTTTTTSTPPPCGTCQYQMGYTGDWIMLTANCTGYCICVYPDVPASPGDKHNSPCEPPPTTTTSSTTTTTQPPCVGQCKYVWSDTSKTWSLDTSTCGTPTTTTTTAGPTTTTSTTSTTTTTSTSTTSTTTTTAGPAEDVWVCPWTTTTTSTACPTPSCQYVCVETNGVAGWVETNTCGSPYGCYDPPTRPCLPGEELCQQCSTTTTTSTSTTTTTGGPTTTTTSTTTTTAAPCQCIPPAYCGSFDGECTYTNCGGSVYTYVDPQCGQTTTTTTGVPTTTTTGDPSTTTTTTTCPPQPTTTTTASPCGGTCKWVWALDIDPDGGEGKWYWISKGDCGASCLCDKPTPLDQHDACSRPTNCCTQETACRAAPTTTTASPGGQGGNSGCPGICRWIWPYGSTNYTPDGLWKGNGWIFSGGTDTWNPCTGGGCNDNRGYCHCFPPSYDGPECGGYADTPCQCVESGTTADPGTTTTTPPCWTTSTTSTTSSSTTTTTLAPCDQSCKWQWSTGSSTWTTLSDPCSSYCPCSQPLFDGVADCQTAMTACHGTPTTTTTATPCATKTCTYQWGYLHGEAAHWIYVATVGDCGDNCFGCGCNCCPPTDRGWPGLVKTTACASSTDACPTTTTTTQSPTTTTTTTTTTTAAPCTGACYWYKYAEGWSLQSSTCNSQCHCDALSPSFGNPGDYYTASCNPGAPSTTTGEPTTTTTTTTTTTAAPNCIYESCQWSWNGSYWGIAVNNCPDCTCCPPTDPAPYSPFLASTNCAATSDGCPTTTSTGEPTTTTTTTTSGP